MTTSPPPDHRHWMKKGWRWSRRSGGGRSRRRSTTWRRRLPFGADRRDPAEGGEAPVSERPHDRGQPDVHRYLASPREANATWLRALDGGPASVRAKRSHGHLVKSAALTSGEALVWQQAAHREQDAGRNVSGRLFSPASGSSSTQRIDGASAVSRDPPVARDPARGDEQAVAANTGPRAPAARRHVRRQCQRFTVVDAKRPPEDQRAKDAL